MHHYETSATKMNDDAGVNHPGPKSDSASNPSGASLPQQHANSDNKNDILLHDVLLPSSIVDPVLLAYRSTGIGVFGVVMRFGGMPLEKMALVLNSSQIQPGKGSSWRQAWRLTFPTALAPYQVVGPASLRAWFLQYSVMGLCFQTIDHGLSRLLQVPPVYYGAQLMEAAPNAPEAVAPWTETAKSSFKLLAAPLVSAALETQVSNRAEVQRYFGREKLARLLKTAPTSWLRSSAGPAFAPCFMRNFIMCQTTFVWTPVTYKLYFPQEHKTPTSLFWYGLAMNVFVGNGLAITQQALWGRTLDHWAMSGKIHYRTILQQAWQREGRQALITLPKWSSRVLMNAPAQGVLPWFYNEVLPLGESALLGLVQRAVLSQSKTSNSSNTSAILLAPTTTNQPQQQHLATSND